MIDSDRGSTMPLIIGFFLIGLLVVAGAVAAGQAFVQQRDLQDVCDGAAAATAAAAADVDRSVPLGNSDAVRFSGVQALAARYVRRDHSDVAVQARLTDSDHTIRLRCTATKPVVFGAVFGKSHGVRHVVDASARGPVT